MENFLAKISSYNIFNYLLPGALFSFSLPLVTEYSVDQNNLLVAAFLYYFIGMVISRIGSLCVEPLLKKSGFLKFSEYGDFIRASAHDEKLETLSEANNTYRTICALILCLVLAWAYSVAEQRCPFLLPIAPYLVIAFIFVLFLFSYRKQTNYITKRVNAHKQK
jgi:hypothetical protein